jgi:hypothetical protein
MTRWNPRARLFVLLLLALALAAAFTTCAKAPETAEGVKYHCPMHPTFVSDGPADCPICGMRLVPMEPEDAEDAKSPDTTAGADGHGGEPEGPASSPPGAVEGYATVRMGAEGIRLSGVRTAAVVRGRQVRTVRTVGLVAPDERRVRQVTTKVGGWVERLHVNFTGQLVRKGAPVLTIYSPELLASQEEFLRARAAGERFRGSTLPDVRESGDALVRAARDRLRLFDVPEAFLEELERTGETERTVTLVAPVSGHVTAKDVLEGARIEPGMPLFAVTDLAVVWVGRTFTSTRPGRSGSDRRPCSPFPTIPAPGFRPG